MFNLYKKNSWKVKWALFLSASYFMVHCTSANDRDDYKTSTNIISEQNDTIIHEDESTIATRFSPPGKAFRPGVDKNSWASYLRHLPLKKYDTKVKYYDGESKRPNGVYCSVVDMSLGKRDLQQCADAVMRLRGEYLFEKKEFQNIHFNFLSDARPRYFLDHSSGRQDYDSFLKYMDYIFAFANTSSLHDEMKKVPALNEMEIGDVFIQKGSPFGHAVIVVDMCRDTTDNKKYFMLAQSYMPAQDTQILINPTNASISPWYELNEGSISTPEWNFKSSDLRRF